jgi:hypothetical protein
VISVVWGGHSRIPGRYENEVNVRAGGNAVSIAEGEYWI